MKPSPIFADLAESICSHVGMRSPTFAGRGAFKETYRVSDVNSKPYALKIFDPDKVVPTRTDREIGAMLKCSSERIAKLIKLGEHIGRSGLKYLYAVEEFFEGGNLTDRLKLGPLGMRESCSYGMAILEAIEHLSVRRLVHRDIKPDNIMFRKKDPQPVLIDLGLVRDLSETSATLTFAPRGPGTPFFSSPEQLNNDKALIDWRSDQYSLGIVLGICLTGGHPFQSDGSSVAHVVTSMENRQNISAQFRAQIEGLGCQWIFRMLKPWPVERYSAMSDIRQHLMRGVS